MPKSSDRIGFAFRIITAVVRPTLALLTRRERYGIENIPASGPVILACNHISTFDPPVLGGYLYELGRVGRFLSKASVLRIPVVGAILRSAGNIPVERRSANARAALIPAKRELDAGGCIVIFPEGTLTDHPDGWPIKGKTGAVRLALLTGAPLIPTAVWGTRDIAHRGSRRRLFLKRSRVAISFGTPLNLDAYADGADSPDALRAGTAELMSAITAQLAELRGEQPPVPGVKDAV